MQPIPVQEMSSDDSYQQSSASEQTSSSDEDSSSNVTDPLAKLPEAKRAAVSRERSLSRTSKPKGKAHRVAGGPSTKMKRIASYERLKDFKGEYLSTSMGVLYCDACHVMLCTKKSIIKNHIRSDCHKRAKEKMEKERAHQLTLHGYIVEEVPERARFEFVWDWIVSCNLRRRNREAGQCR